MTAVGKAEPDQPGHTENGRVELAVLDFAEPAMYVAAQWPHGDVGAQPPDLRFSPHRCRAEPCAARQFSTVTSIAGDERVAHISALQIGGDHQSIGRTVGMSFAECTAKSISPQQAKPLFPW